MTPVLELFIILQVDSTDFMIVTTHALLFVAVIVKASWSF